MKIRSVHHHLEVDQDNEKGDTIRVFLKVNQTLELTDNIFIKTSGKPICIISKGD